MKVKDLIDQLQKIDSELTVITTINKNGDKSTVECIELGSYIDNKFISAEDDPKTNINAVELVWLPF